MVGQIYEKKKFLIINSISGRGEYQVISQFREMLSYPMNKWEAKTRDGKNLAIQRMLKGPDPVDKKIDDNEYYWGGAKSVAIEKEKVKITKKKPNQQTNKKKTVSYKRKNPTSSKYSRPLIQKLENYLKKMIIFLSSCSLY